MKLHLHQDDQVFVRDGLTTVYSAPRAQFVADYGNDLPALPEGMVSLIFDDVAKILTYFDAMGNAHPVEGRTDMPELAAVVAGASALTAKMQERETLDADHLEALSMDLLVPVVKIGAPPPPDVPLLIVTMPVTAG